MNLDRKFLPVIIVLSLVLGFGGGLLFSRYNSAASNVPVLQKLVNQDSGKPEDIDFGLFWKVWSILSDKYVDKSKLDAQKMTYGAIQGMVGALGDPYTVFFEPVTSKAFKEEVSGAFGGVGMELGMKNNALTVIAAIKDTPAFAAGIQAGDRITKIDGKSTSGQTIDSSVALIRGKVGTKVTLTVTNIKNESRDVTLTRETIKVPTVEWKMIDQNGKHVAYIQAYEFNDNIISQFKTAADEATKAGANAIIIDLRNNPGGLLDSAINLAGYYVERGRLVVSERFGNGTQNDFNSDGNATLKKYPTVILVNGGSASASEILSGALHDNDNIKLIGEKTFGKGSVQELEDLDGGTSLKVTVARWYTPNGINISLKGIDPDIKVELTDDQKKVFMPGDPTKDPQLEKALEVIAK